MIHCMRPLQVRGAITAIVTMNSLMMSVLWRERGPLAQWTTTTELSAMLSWRATLGRGSAWMYLIGVGILQSSTLWRIALVLSRKNASTRFLPDQGGPSRCFFCNRSLRNRTVLWARKHNMPLGDTSSHGLRSVHSFFHSAICRAGEASCDPDNYNRA